MPFHALRELIVLSVVVSMTMGWEAPLATPHRDGAREVAKTSVSPDAGQAARPRPERGRPDAAAIFTRAEAVRSPDLDYAADFTIDTPQAGAPDGVRRARYLMVAHGKNATIVLMVQPDMLFGATLLIADGSYWLLLARATKPLQLSAEQILHGDVSNGDLARSNLLADYSPDFEGDDRLEGEPCWRILLTRTAEKARYTRIRTWIAKDGDRPRQMDYYGMTGEALKTVRYRDYAKTPIGVRARTIEVEDHAQGQGTSTMTFSGFRTVDPRALAFTTEGMAALREAALSLQSAGRDVRAETLLAALKTQGR